MTDDERAVLLDVLAELRRAARRAHTRSARTRGATRRHHEAVTRRLREVLDAERARLGSDERRPRTGDVR